MSNLMVQRHVFRPLSDLRRELDHIVDQVFGHAAMPAISTDTVFALLPSVESWIDEENKELHLTIPLPGLKPEEITVQLQGRRLLLAGKREEKEEHVDKSFLQREFSTRQFSRVFDIADGIDADKLTAKFNDGVLEITAPVAAHALPRTIEVVGR